MIDFKMTRELVIALVFFVLVVLFGSWYLMALSPLVFIILFHLYKNKEDKLTINLLDIAFAFIALGELITSLFSSYKETGSNTSINIYIILFLYVVYRTYFKSYQKKILFLTVLLFLSIIIVLITLVSFGIHYHGLLEENITELNNFKNLYNPLGVWNNLWACILLLLLAFTLLFVLYQKKQKFKILGLLVAALLVFGIIISFSRGLYLSVLCFFISFNIFAVLFKQLKVKQLLSFNFIALAIGLLSLFIVKDSVLTTIAFNKTTSQQRSTSGRLDRWEHALELISDKPITGWGNDNFILAKDKTPYLSEDAIFSTKIDNTYLQILIEKGILGFLSYLFLVAVCFTIIYKSLKSKKYNRKQKLELIILISGLMAFLVRELTFSSLFLNNTVFFLAFHLVFFLIPYDIECYKVSISNKIKHSILFGFLLVTPFLLFTQVENAIQNNRNNQFVKAFNKDENEEAFVFLDKAMGASTNNIILNKHAALLFSKNALQIDISKRNNNLLMFKHINKDSLEISKMYLKKILKSNPYDDETYHNLGWIYFAFKENDSAKVCFKKAIEMRPYNSTYRISKMLYDINNSDYKNGSENLSKVIRYSPDIIESAFYKAFSTQYPKERLLAEKEAVLGLRNILKIENNPILKARLARLLLKKDSAEPLKLLEEITASLPNLSRPWVYKGFLYEKKGDTAKANEFYNKGIFLNKGDFFPKLYYANFLRRIGENKKSVAMYKEALQLYSYVATENFMKNREMSSFKTIQSSYIPNDLLYYVKPIIPYEDIFNYFIDYYKSINDIKSYEFYKNLSKKYHNQLYKGKEILY